MLVLLNGQERTLGNHIDLARESGWKITHLYKLADSFRCHFLANVDLTGGGFAVHSNVRLFKAIGIRLFLTRGKSMTYATADHFRFELQRVCFFTSQKLCSF